MTDPHNQCQPMTEGAVAWRVYCTNNGATGFLYTEQLPFEPGPGVHVRREPEPLYAESHAALRARVNALEAECDRWAEKSETTAASLRSQVSELRDAQTWQPIDTAPRNKTMVALICTDGSYARYGVGWYMPLVGWQAWYSGDYHNDPTHWMALPKPSSVNSQDGGSPNG